MGIEVKVVAGDYVIYNGNQYVMKFNRKENAEFVARIIKEVRLKDIKGYKYKTGEN